MQIVFMLIKNLHHICMETWPNSYLKKKKKEKKRKKTQTQVIHDG